MASPSLSRIAEALTNIGGSIAECARQMDANSTPDTEHFEASLTNECRRLHGIGEEGLAGALESMRGPMLRLIREGW